ncbi:hypothetical protein L1F30_08745 [Simiduia sp. 21SJ11W-1]|uniref:hypothetical protein n=1 Tax=Simiduia sp. 21SJ11W-1 TaxID=2909669 RepID=UPI0020A1B435|nr:hypothetical protein [Simiduia sp. 21SJ11W-1]UTA49608.1 hypothetical protein L1F30_08745 [Simiduia sp. 21SJ11W-1]
MSSQNYCWRDGLNDLATLFGQRWVALPLIALLIYKVVSIAPASVWYLPPLLLLTLLTAIRLTAALAIKDQRLLMTLYAEQKHQADRRRHRD